MYNIGITGVGGGVGQSVLKALANTDYNIIAMDGELLGAGLYSSNTSYLIPYANNPDYVKRLLEICKKEKISLLFPGLDAELMILALNKKAFEKIGTIVVVSRPEVISISDNKQETFDKLTKLGINVPFTTSLLDYNPNEKDFPIIIKQKEGGARSKNIFVVRDEIDWKHTIENIGENAPNFIVMEYIEGDEYTCGSICLNEKCQGVIVMRRILRDGDTHKCFVENNEIIEKEVIATVNAIKPFGACNIQLRLKNDRPYVFEINARCSGTTGARALSGFNEPRMIADFILKGIQPNYKIKEQTILRYWKEIVVDNNNIEKMKRNLVLRDQTGTVL